MADDVAALEKRITSLESKYTVTVGIAAAVAVIFGLSGAWGSKLLFDANEKIAQMQASLAKVSETYAGYRDALKKTEETAIANVNSSAKDALKREADNQLAALSNQIAKIQSERGAVSEPNLIVSPINTDHPPYPQLKNHVCPAWSYVTGAVNVSGTFTFQCRLVGIIAQ